MATDGAVAALNFASATHPGGGFLSGARAQEESIARSSGLFACLEGREMYSWHRSRLDAMYSDWIIYSPDVPVFRTDDGELLEERVDRHPAWRSVHSAARFLVWLFDELVLPILARSFAQVS